MAHLALRNVFSVARRGFFSSAARLAAPEDLPHPMNVATGLEKKEILAREAGNDDRFNVKTIKRGVCTKENPMLIPSAYDSRVVGCICNDNTSSILWMWLHKGAPHQCECGHYFQLVYKPAYEA